MLRAGLLSRSAIRTLHIMLHFDQIPFAQLDTPRTPRILTISPSFICFVDPSGMSRQLFVFDGEKIG